MNRYWFSQKQKEQHEKHCSRSGSSSRKAEVLTDEGWKEYTQWCSSGDDCSWEDAVLVAESENELPIRIDGYVQGYGGYMNRAERRAEARGGK